VKLLWLWALLIPLDFWYTFEYTIPRLISETPYWVHHRVIIIPSDYRAEELIRVGRAFTKACGETPLCVLYMAPGNNYLASYSPRSVHFDNWRYNVELFLRDGWQPIPDIAEVNVVDGEAVLRMRKDGKVSRYVLTGKDPLIYRIEGQEFEVLEIYGRLSGREVKREYEEGGTVVISTCEECVTYLDVSVRTKGQLDLARFRKLVQQLARIQVPADLQVSLRRDPWFVPTSMFPMLYAFDERLPALPSRREWAEAGELAALVSRRRKQIIYYEYSYDGERQVQVERGREPLAEQ